MRTNFTFNLLVALCLLATTSIHAQFQWAKQMGGGIYDKGKRLVTDASGNVYTVGEFSGVVDFDPGVGTFTSSPSGCFIQKMDPAGNFLWAKSFAGYSTEGISKDASGNISLVGLFYGTIDFDPGPGTYTLTSSGGVSLPNSYVLKVDANGNFIWAARWGNTNTTSKDISNDAAGNTFITGMYNGITDFDPGPSTYTMGVGTAVAGYILKLDASGNFGWAKEMKASSVGASATGTAIQPDGLGNIITTGFFGGTVDFDPGAATYTLTAGGSLYDLFVQKLDASGNLIWALAVGSPTVSDVSFAIAIDASNNIYSCGNFGNSVDFDPGVGVTNLTASGTSDAYVWKLDPTGNFLWAKNFGDNAWSLSVGASGDVYTIGYTGAVADLDPGAGTYTVSGVSGFIQKMDAAGNFAWARGYFLGTSFNDICVNGNDIYFTGRINGTVDFDPDAPVFNLNGGSLYAIFVSKLSSYATSINENSFQTANFKLFPNPSNGKVKLFLEKQYFGNIEVYDVLGNSVHSQFADNVSEIEMNLVNLKNGIYFTRINETTIKLVIED